MFDKSDSHIKNITKSMKISKSEKEIIEFFLNNLNIEKKLSPIGNVKDIESEFKNDVFDIIFEDENGVIIDVRMCDKKPTVNEMDNYSQYWIELRNKYKKFVQPYFILSER